MTADAKSKTAVNLLKLGFIDLSLGFEFLVSMSVRRLLFGSRTNLFLLCKAETAARTRQLFQPTRRSREDRFLCTSCSRGQATPATLSPPQRNLIFSAITDVGVVWDVAGQSGADSAVVAEANRISERTNRRGCKPTGFAHKNSLAADRSQLAE